MGQVLRRRCYFLFAPASLLLPPTLPPPCLLFPRSFLPPKPLNPKTVNPGPPPPAGEAPLLPRHPPPARCRCRGQPVPRAEHEGAGRQQRAGRGGGP